MAITIRCGEFDSILIDGHLLTIVSIGQVVEVRVNLESGEEFEFAIVEDEDPQQIVGIGRNKGFAVTANGSRYGRVAVSIYAMKETNNEWVEVTGKASVAFLPVSRIER